jgi:hypothetical protein
MRENIKVIFLDIDGVLNSYDWRLKNKEKSREIKCLDDSAIEVLAEIVKSSGAKIVLSSSWRTKDPDDVYMQILVSKFEKFGLSIFGMTGHCRKKLRRGWEIRQWLKDNKKTYNILSFVVIDDDSDDIVNHKKTLRPYYVKTSFKDGLRERHIDKILHVLNGGKVNLTFISKRDDPEWKTDKYWFRKYIQEIIDES